MNLRRNLAVVLVFLFILVSTAQPANDLTQTTNSIAGSILTGSSMDTLRELADGFGARLTGSTAYEQAAEWAAAKFRSYGIKNVHLEPFTIPNDWQRGSATGQMLAPQQRPLHIESYGWAPATPFGGFQGDVIVVDDLAADQIKARSAQIKGHIVLLDTSKVTGGFLKLVPVLYASYDHFKEAGAIAVMLPDHENNNVLNAHGVGWGAKLSQLPVLAIGMEDSKLIGRLLGEKTTVTVRLETRNQVSGAAQVNNVIAEIRGREHPDEWILVGAHLDSWDFATGAQDNGAGSVMVLEAARAIASLGQPPRRSIRFALWGGEEEGLLGSEAYAQAHTADLERCIAVLNTDNGAGHPQGWKVQGRKDLKDAMQPVSQSVLANLSGTDLSMETTYDTDHGPFLLRGIPALDLEVDMSHYMEVHHKASDTVDKVDDLNLRAGAAIVAATAYALAETPNPIAPHIDHTAVGEIIKQAGLEEFLQSMGLWKP